MSSATALSGRLRLAFLSVIALSICVPGASSASENANGGNQAVIPWGPYLQDLTPTGVTVMWTANTPNEGVVEYGGSKDKLDKRVAAKVVDSKEGCPQEATLTGLKPGTIYHYRVTSTPKDGRTAVSGEPGSFATPIGGEQYKWLDNELKSSKDTWKFVFQHLPVYSAWGGKMDPRLNDLRQLYEKNKVDVVSQGHMHNYDRTFPLRDQKPVSRADGGVTYITASGACGGYEKFPHPHRLWFIAKQWRGAPFVGLCSVSGKHASIQFVTASGVEVADIFGPEMILQREAPVPVWGRAEPGEKVTVTFAGQSKTATADGSGRWLVKLDAMAASDRPRPLAVKGASKPITFENVRVGEVWLVLCRRIGRQYSCEGPVPNDDTRIRGFGASRDNHSPTPVDAFGRNDAWGPSRRHGFDVLSIPFANRLSEALGSPVGVVRVTVGDLDATIPVQGFGAIPALDDIAERVDTWYPTTKRGKQAYEKWFAQLKQWRRTLARKIDRGESIEPTQPPLVPGPALGDPTQPTVVFNRQLHPLVPFAFRGVLHVHDEAPNGDPRYSEDARYAQKMRALIAGLRAVFKRPDLAFAFSQRSQPNIYHAHTAGGTERRNTLNFNAWHGHRDRQRRVLPFKNTGMVVTSDIENYSGKVGDRFARWAVAQVYGKRGASSGPIYKSHRLQGDRVIIDFHHTDGGLMAAGYPEIGRPLAEQKDGRLRFFAVAGADRIFHRAEARIESNTVVVRSGRAAKPVAVRYACHFDPRGMNLYNRAGLPASPFSTDDWPIGSLEEALEKCASKSAEELAAMLGYPTMLHSHAAAKALAAKGQGTVLPIVKRLLTSKDPDRRCGGLRTLGYLYWMGIIPRGSGYYNQQPQEVTPAIGRAIDLIRKAAQDADPLVRRCAAEALSLIGSENETVFSIVKKLALDDDALVRTAAMRTSKYRFNTHAHNTALAYAVLNSKPLADRTSVALAGNLLNHYRIKGPIDVRAIARYLKRIGPGQGGTVVGGLGDALRRIQLPNSKKKALDHPEVMSAVLHLYGMGYRNYFLYGVWRWVTFKDHTPAIGKEIQRLQSEIQRLRREKPDNWKDLSSRYADAIEALSEVLATDKKSRKRKK